MNRIRPQFEKVLKRFTQGQDINQMVDNFLQNGAIYFLDIETYEDELNRFILGVIYRRFRRRTSYFFRKKKYSKKTLAKQRSLRISNPPPSSINPWERS